MKVLAGVVVLMGARLLAADFNPFKDGGATELPKQTGGAAVGDFNPDQWLKNRIDSEKKAVAAAKGVNDLSELASDGNVEAAFVLGSIYGNGDGVAKDSAEAVKWYRMAAERGHAGAQHNLGASYAAGEGVVKDSAEAVKWYRKAAEQGDVSAQSKLGFAYFTGYGISKDSAEAVKWYRKVAERGDASVQLMLGGIFRYGDGVAKDSAEAVKWYRMAAEQGDAFAQFFLGTMYRDGDGVPKDSAEAVKWYRMAAEQGKAFAQSRLGSMYRVGEGVAKDSAEALKWFRLAADQGDASAQFDLGLMYGIGAGVAKDSAEAVKWYRKAAEQGNDMAQGNLGLMYDLGEGVAKDSAEAVKWYRKAAEQGNAKAQGNLGSMYSNGDGVAKDAIEGLAWTNIAAASGNEIFAKNRSLNERQLGPQATLLAQQRSKEILKEIEAAKRGVAAAPALKAPTAAITPMAETPRFSGSGTIVSADGHVLTAAHVVAGAKSVKVVTVRGTTTAKVLRIDEANDLAVLKLVGGTYAALPVAASRTVRLGQTVATIGFPNIDIQGFSPKVTRGEISSLNGIGDDPRAWQISVPVQTGNSGGPLLDESGNLVGVVVAKLGMAAARATGDLPQNVSYAVKSAYALVLLEPYVDGGGAEGRPSSAKLRFEDMVAKAQQSAVLILVY